MGRRRLGQPSMWNPARSWCPCRRLRNRWWQGLLEGEELVGSDMGRTGLPQDGSQQEPVWHLAAAFVSNWCQGYGPSATSATITSNSSIATVAAKPSIWHPL